MAASSRPQSATLVGARISAVLAGSLLVLLIIGALIRPGMMMAEIHAAMEGMGHMMGSH